jgi:threonine dehydratase
MREVSLETVRDAAKHVYDVAVRTPLVRLDLPGVPRPSPAGGGALQVYLKLESLQPIGSFKIRGAYNAVRQLGPADLERGVWTVSAGNAAQGVALAARTAGARCSVLVIETAPRTKLQAIEQLGASVVKVSYEEAWQTVQTGRSDRMSGAFIHPFADPHFISGNGTVGLEIVEDLPDVDVVVAAVGGGGLLSGIAAAVRALRPGARLYGAEPETAAPLAASLQAGRASTFPKKSSFVDGAGGMSVIDTMWPYLSRLDGSIVVSLDEVGRAMREVADRVHVVAEGAAGCAVAAALSGRVGAGKIVAVVSGGNVDLTTFASVVGAAPPV